jgi:hypothetical protein
MERNSGEDERDRNGQDAEEAGRAEKAEKAEKAEDAGQPAGRPVGRPSGQPTGQDVSEGDSGRDAGTTDVPLPLDEKAAWEQIVASYGDAPKAEDLAPARPEGERDTDEGSGSPVRSLTVYPAIGPRDWSLARDEPEADSGEDADDEGHFEPPEPPPLPEADTTAKFAWLAVLGGPLLLIVTVLLQQELTWWIGTLGVGGFLGGFATLVARMRDGRDEDDWEDPGRGAVV